MGIEAPKEYRIYREEIYLAILEENRKAAAGAAEEMAGLENISQMWQGGAPAGEGGDSDDEARKRTAGDAAGAPSAFSSLRVAKPALKNPEIVIKRKRGKQDE